MGWFRVSPLASGAMPEASGDHARGLLTACW
jgi:hypothetical protein